MTNFNYIRITVTDGEKENKSQQFMFSNASEMERTTDFITNYYATKYNVPVTTMKNKSNDIKTFQIKYEKKSITITLNYGFEQSRDITRFIKETINM